MPATETVSHTPSPWRVGATGIVVADSGNIAKLAGASLEGDAALIAAAPELLSWLEAISYEADEWDNHDGRLAHVAYTTILQARQVIVKARGEADDR